MFKMSLVYNKSPTPATISPSLITVNQQLPQGNINLAINNPVVFGSIFSTIEKTGQCSSCGNSK